VTSLADKCYRWRFAVLGGWLVALIGLAVLTLGAGSAFTDSAELPDSESGTAYRLLAGVNPTAGDTESGNIAWHTDGVAINAPSVRKDFTAMLEQVSTLPGVQSVTSPYSKAGAELLDDGTNTAYAAVVMAKDADVEPVVQAAEALRGSGVQVEVGGTAFTEQPGASGGTEAIGILAALVILLLVFRSLWAAFLPIVTGVMGVVTSLLVVVLASHLIDLAATSLTMGALIGLGVGIDYALFIVNRYRKAVLAGSSVPEAIAQSLSTSGRAVVFAGITVIVALLGMYVVNLGILTGMAQAAALTVFFTVLSAITLLPALLAVLGHRVLSRKQRKTLVAGSPVVAAPSSGLAAAPSGLAARWAALVQRAPLRTAVLALLVIVALASPVASMRVGDADASSDPAGSTGRAYFDLMSTGFGDGFDAGLLLVAQTPDAASVRAFGSLVDRLPSVEGVASVVAAPVKAGQQIAVATVVPVTSAQTEETSNLVHDLRDEVIPGAESGTALQVHVGGTTATGIDISDALMSKLPLYLGLIGILGFLLLALAFRSVLVPLIGALSNVATIFVGLGAVTAIFQFGWGSELLGVGSGAPVMYLIPVLIVGIMFGLSMDYQVFLVSRMHEEWTHTKENARSVRVGVTETGQVIAAAATIMLCVFSSFGFSGERIVSMIGIGLAVAVVVDAFVVRLTLVPALMQLIGRSNWYYPGWAERFTPQLSIEGPTGSADPVDEKVLV
jgi:RND superfamily putative drug exporter